MTDVVDVIQQGIRSGQYVPGQRLIEADLAGELGVRRTSVRDALRVLAGDGVVELVPQKGARVRRMSPDDLRDLVPVLAGLLRTALRLAIPRLGDPALRARLEAAQAALRHARMLEDFGLFQAMSLRYTEILHEAAANRYLDYLHAKLHPDVFNKQLAGAVEIGDWNEYLQHFDQVHAAVMAGNLSAALALIDVGEARMSMLFTEAAEPFVWR